MSVGLCAPGRSVREGLPGALSCWAAVGRPISRLHGVGTTCRSSCLAPSIHHLLRPLAAGALGTIFNPYLVFPWSRSTRCSSRLGCAWLFRLPHNHRHNDPHSHLRSWNGAGACAIVPAGHRDWNPESSPLHVPWQDPQHTFCAASFVYTQACPKHL